MAPAFVIYLLALVPVLFLSRLAAAQAFTELYAFNSSGNLSDGGTPEAGVTRDADGNLYGTTFFGGTGTGCDIYYAGCGTVFKLDTSGTETVLHSFGGAHDGWNPTARLILDEAGNLYGTTGYGGAHGHGTVFKVDKAGNETIIHSFAGGTDGDRPNAGLVEDTAGNLYGTTQYGGRGCDGHGCGTVFRISVDDRETVLYRDFPDGASPWAESRSIPRETSTAQHGSAELIALERCSRSICAAARKSCTALLAEVTERIRSTRRFSTKPETCSEPQRPAARQGPLLLV
jgi:uncharacterized repeat protein (TIGR03803 family)